MQRLALVLTIANAALLAFLLLVQARPALEPMVIRTRALEIVDDQGRVRASIAVYPEDPSVTFEGRVYPETVLLRLIDPNGGPDVKLSASARGTILLLGGGAPNTYVQIGADQTTSFVKLTNKDGKELLLRP
jgi:hypothetical protein